MASIFVSVEELADRLGVTRSCVYTWTRRRGPESIPRVRLGRRYGFDVDDVVRWLKEQQPGRSPAVARPARIKRHR